jgi:hypothetical protein
VFSRASSKLLLTLVIAAFLTLGLVACGASDDSTQSTGASTSGGDVTATTDGGAEGDSSEDSGSEQGTDSFIVPGGDNSIQEYGKEADSAELKAAEDVLNEYFDARAAKDWAKSCSLLSEEARAPLEQLAKASPKLKGADCAEILEKLQGSIPTADTGNPMINGLAAMRVAEGRGFALFHGAKGTDYFILMSNQGDEWTVAALAPSEFP